jgi:hypothetical protein
MQELPVQVATSRETITPVPWCMPEGEREEGREGGREGVRRLIRGHAMQKGKP